MTKEKQEKVKIIKPAIRKHESFEIRRGWLHKGIRNVLANTKLFSKVDDDSFNACDKLGLGVNMVKALRYWLKATQLITDKSGESKLTKIGEIINEHDKYFEERGTNYIIHYLLANNQEEATAWYWLFNEHRSSTIDKDTFITEFGDFCKSMQTGDEKISPKVLADEFACLMRTYYRKSDEQESDPEETKICPLVELRLLSPQDNKREFKKMMPDRDDIHPLIAYAVISKNQKSSTQIKIDSLISGKSNIGKIFNLDRSTVFYIVEKLEQLGLISVVRTAGLDVINVKRKMTFEECLTEYYIKIGEVLNG